MRDGLNGVTTGHSRSLSSAKSHVLAGISSRACDQSNPTITPIFTNRNIPSQLAQLAFVPPGSETSEKTFNKKLNPPSPGLARLPQLSSLAVRLPSILPIHERRWLPPFQAHCCLLGRFSLLLANTPKSNRFWWQTSRPPAR